MDKFRTIRSRKPKRVITIRLDADILEYFKSGGSGYQSRINDALRAFMEVERA